jgi:hypothetical protein
MYQSPELQRLIERSEKTGTKQQLEAALLDVETVITNASSASLTSNNPDFRTVTGNLYQSIQLYSKDLAGFRSPRRNLFSGFRLKDKCVADYGSNLGEISRTAAALGAAEVNSYEYEPYFVFMARLINVLLGQEHIRTHLADISTEEPYQSGVDIALALSVDTFISGQLASIAAKTRDVLIYESHAIEKRLLKGVMRKLMAHFPHVALIDAFDHGKALPSWRVLCAASRHPLDRIIHARFGEINANIRVSIDLSRSHFVFWNAAAQSAAGWSEHLARAKQELQGQDDDALERACEQVAQKGIAAAPLYWSSFTVGLLDAKQGVLIENNFYFKLLNRLLDRKVYDGLWSQLRSCEPEKFSQRIRSRLSLVELAPDNMKPIIINGFWSPTEQNVQSAGSSVFVSELSDRYAALIFDGFHRLYAALLNGISSCPAQVIIYPQVDNFKRWNLDAEEMQNVTTECLEKLLMSHDASESAVGSELHERKN